MCGGGGGGGGGKNSGKSDFYTFIFFGKLIFSSIRTFCESLIV